MTTQQKNQVIEDAVRYMNEKSISQARMAVLTGINEGYLSNMLRGNYKIKIGNGHIVDIDEKWFYALSEKVGSEVEKQYWETVPTPEFVQMITSLESFKKTSKSGMIIGSTGMGKTYTCEKFASKHPQHTYKVTVNELHTLGDILNDLLFQMGADTGGSYLSRLEKIRLKMRWLKRQGGKPIIILDEFENAKSPLIKTIKALYDGIKGYGSIVLIGTDQLPKKIERLRSLNRDGMPQFWRRFKAGTKHIEPMQRKNFASVLEKMGVNDKGLCRLLHDLCDNYGELNDYLEPALRESDLEGKPLTEDYFRLLYNLPKY